MQDARGPLLEADTPPSSALLEAGASDWSCTISLTYGYTLAAAPTTLEVPRRHTRVPPTDPPTLLLLRLPAEPLLLPDPPPLRCTVLVLC